MDKLDVVLAEYKALRAEITDKFRLYLQIYSIYASALLVFYGLVFVHRVYDLVIAIPIFSLALLFRILWEQTVINHIGRYIRIEIEQKKIPRLTETMQQNDVQNLSSSKLWMGWQHFWHEQAQPQSPAYHKYSLRMLFLLFSVVPAVSYTVYSIIAPLAKLPVVTLLPLWILIPLLILNLSLGCYMHYKINHH